MCYKDADFSKWKRNIPVFGKVCYIQDLNNSKPSVYPRT